MKKVSISSENTVTLTCPSCGKTKAIDTTRYKKREGTIKIKFTFKCRHCYCGKEHAAGCDGINCKQGHTMVAWLERRRHIRQKVNFQGKVIDERKHVARVKVRNISKKGMLLQVLTPKTFDVGEVLTVFFVLDNAQKAEIKKKVVIRKMLPPNLLGVEFNSADTFWGLD